MKSDEIMRAVKTDALQAYAWYETMTTTDLQRILASHERDQRHATKPDAIAFTAGRIALIAHVLATRKKAK